VSECVGFNVPLNTVITGWQTKSNDHQTSQNDIIHTASQNTRHSMHSLLTVTNVCRMSTFLQCCILREIWLHFTWSRLWPFISQSNWFSSVLRYSDKVATSLSAVLLTNFPDTDWQLITAVQCASHRCCLSHFLSLYVIHTTSQTLLKTRSSYINCHNANKHNIILY